MFDLVPFAGAGGQVANRDLKTGFIGQFLQLAECVNDFETLFSRNYCRSFSSSGCPGLCAAGSSGLLIQTALGRG